MKDLASVLSNKELEHLDQFLIQRIDEVSADPDKDEGVLNLSELDGFFTAVISGPTMVVPSQWLPAVWGEFEPVWESEKEFKNILSLMIRHMNGIVGLLMESPEQFEPIYLEHKEDGVAYTIVDDWCEGYWRGLQLTQEHWDRGGKEMVVMLTPILAFTSATEWRGHDFRREEVEKIQGAIAPNVGEIYAYWLARRDELNTVTSPVRKSTPKVGRNEPCPCGSGKKYKKCCLH